MAETASAEPAASAPDAPPTNTEEYERIAAYPYPLHALAKRFAPHIVGLERAKRALVLSMASADDSATSRGRIHVLLHGPPSCLIGDERIVLGDGTFAKIGEIAERHLQPLKLRLRTGQGWRTDWATMFHIYRQQPTIEVVTESGKSIRGTANHPLLTFQPDGKFGNSHMRREWRRLDEMKIGDRVAVAAWIGCYRKTNVETDFVPQRVKKNSRAKARLPKIVDEDFAWILGYALGDGWMDKYRFSFIVADSEADLFPMLDAACQRVFGVSPHHQRRQDKWHKMAVHIGVINDRDVAANLAFLAKKRVPNLILRSPNKPLAAFLSGLFEADGHVRARVSGRAEVALTAKDIELLRDVQILLLRFGVHSRVHGVKLTVSRPDSIRRFAARIGFRSSKKRVRMEAALQAVLLRKRRTKRLRYERIVEIQQGAPADVFDVEVPESQRFIANGIISHNTAKTSLLYALAREAETDVFSQRISSGGLTLDFRTGKVGVFGALHDTEFQVVCLDELDKVQPEVADLLLSAMENGQITYAGGGQSGTIPAHLKVAAAANDASSLSQELLNRFDYRIFVPLPRRAEAGRIVDAMARGFMRPPGAGTEAGFVRGYLRWVRDVRPAFDDRERALAAHVFRVLVGTEPGEEVSLRPYQAVLRSAFAVARIERGDVTAERVMAAVEILYPERDFSDRFGALRGLLRYLRKSGRRAPRHWKPGAVLSQNGG